MIADDDDEGDGDDGTRDGGARETGGRRRRSDETRRAGIDDDDDENEGRDEGRGARMDDARVGIRRVETKKTTDDGFSVGVELLERRSDGE